MSRERAQAVLVLSTPLFIAGAKPLAELGLRHKLPSLYGPKQHVEAGGLMSYSPDRADLWDGRHQDLRVGDPADALSARMLLGEYARVMSTLTAEDVLASHEASLGG